MPSDLEPRRHTQSQCRIGTFVLHQAIFAYKIPFNYLQLGSLTTNKQKGTTPSISVQSGILNGVKFAV